MRNVKQNSFAIIPTYNVASYINTHFLQPQEDYRFQEKNKSPTAVINITVDIPANYVFLSALQLKLVFCATLFYSQIFNRSGKAVLLQR